MLIVNIRQIAEIVEIVGIVKIVEVTYKDNLITLYYRETRSASFVRRQGTRALAIYLRNELYQRRGILTKDYYQAVFINL